MRQELPATAAWRAPANLLAARVFHRWVAALLLIAYAVVGTSVLPATVALLADLEGSHQGFIQISRGGARVVLHHAPDDFTPAVNDHACGLARMVVRFCHTDPAGDHQLSAALLIGTANQERTPDWKQLLTETPPSAPVSHSWNWLPSLAWKRVPGDLPLRHAPPGKRPGSHLEMRRMI